MGDSHDLKFPNFDFGKARFSPQVSSELGRSIHRKKKQPPERFPWIVWVFPKIGEPQNGWFIMENHIKMDDLGGKPTIFGNICMASGAKRVHVELLLGHGKFLTPLAGPGHFEMTTTHSPVCTLFWARANIQNPSNLQPKRPLPKLQSFGELKALLRCIGKKQHLEPPFFQPGCKMDFQW